MYDRFKNQFIFKMTNGKVINYYFKENSGICASSINRRNLWSDSVILAKDSIRGFSADIDKNDKISLLYQDSIGNLYVVRYANSQYKTFKLLNSKSVTTYDKHMKIMSFNDTIFCLYIVEHNGNNLLSFQSSNRDFIFANPKVIDYCSDSLLPHASFFDSNGMMVVFYLCGDTKRKNPGIKLINCENDSVSEFIPVSDYSSDALILSGFCDTEGNYILLWERKKEEKYELCYSIKLKNSEKFETEKVIDVSSFSHVNASIIEKNNSLLCYWVISNAIYYSTSSDKKNFGSTEIYRQFEGKQYYCITYKENYPGRLQRVSGETLPVNFSNGLHFAFSDLDMDNLPENRSSTYQDYNSKERYDEYDVRLKAISDRFETLEKKLLQNDMEMQKVLIRINQLESDLNKKMKVSRTRPFDEEVRVNKSYTNIDESSVNKFKNIENKFSNSEFIQDPKIEEIKKQIALETKTSTAKTEKADENKNESEAVRKFKEQQMDNFPIMPGTGFSSITTEYLKNLGKKHE
jgi:hypothetical protein